MSGNGPKVSNVETCTTVLMTDYAHTHARAHTHTHTHSPVLSCPVLPFGRGNQHQSFGPWILRLCALRPPALLNHLWQNVHWAELLCSSTVLGCFSLSGTYASWGLLACGKFSHTPCMQLDSGELSFCWLVSWACCTGSSCLLHLCTTRPYWVIRVHVCATHSREAHEYSLGVT